MNGFEHFWQQGDAVSHAVAGLLLLMSISTWVMILWRAWFLLRVRRDLARTLPAFWASEGIEAACARVQSLDREGQVGVLIDAALAKPPGSSLESQGHQASQLTRRLRDALHSVLRTLNLGQVLLASVGSTSPFIGLFGTVWGIYHALVGISAAGTLSIDKVSGPVGEALIMTAAGLAVAIPAVLAYNVFGKWVGACEAELEGFAHDLREMQLDRAEATGHPMCRPAFETKA